MAKQVLKDTVQFPVLMELSSLKDKIAPRDMDFARSLVTSFNRYGKLTPKQMEFVEVIISRAKGTATPKPSTAVPLDAIQAMFDKAAQKLKRIKVTLQDSAGQKVVFKRAGPASKYAGQILVTDGGPFGAAKFFGNIKEDGQFFVTPKATDSVVNLVNEFAANPEDVAAKYGKLTGGCCFCSKSLNDNRSIAVGYGPVCATHFGLKWGK